MEEVALSWALRKDIGVEDAWHSRQRSVSKIQTS